MLPRRQHSAIQPATADGTAVSARGSGGKQNGAAACCAVGAAPNGGRRVKAGCAARQNQLSSGPRRAEPRPPHAAPRRRVAPPRPPPTSASRLSKKRTKAKPRDSFVVWSCARQGKGGEGNLATAILLVRHATGVARRARRRAPAGCTRLRSCRSGRTAAAGKRVGVRRRGVASRCETVGWSVGLIRGSSTPRSVAREPHRVAHVVLRGAVAQVVHLAGAVRAASESASAGVCVCCGTLVRCERQCRDPPQPRRARAPSASTCR